MPRLQVPPDENGLSVVSRSKDDKYIRALLARADNIGRVRIAKERCGELKEAGFTREEVHRLFGD
jgi:hypothetical protein